MAPFLKLACAVLPSDFLNSVLGLPSLFTRDATCESAVCPDWGSVGGWVEQAIKAMPFTIPGIMNGDTETTRDRQKTPNPDPEIELLITEPSQGSHTCTEVSSSDNGDFPGDVGNTNISPCNTDLGQLIWPLNCADTQQNTDIESLLRSMDSMFMTSNDPLCPQKNGVGFWQAQLTEAQIQIIRQNMGVKAVIRNRPYNFGKLTKMPPSTGPPGVVQPRNTESPLKRREALAITRRPSRDDGLIYLSSPAKATMGSEYVSFSVEKHPVKVWIVDEGLVSTLEDFKGLSIDWILALGAGSRKNYRNVDPTGHGTCIASKITGRDNGIADSAIITMVRTKAEIGSVLDALGQVFLAIQNGNGPRGYTVLHISGGYVPIQGDADMGRMRDLIQALVGYQVIVVTPAGQSEENENPVIGQWPAMLSLDFDIITVGAVDPWRNSPNFGERLPFTASGPAMTVRAPGDGYCARQVPGEPDGAALVGGSDFAAAHVTGLVAYFLSIYPLKIRMLKEVLLPKAMKNYLQAMSKKRGWDEKVPSVWNGIYGHDPNYQYNNWFGLDPIMWQRFPPRQSMLPDDMSFQSAMSDSSTPGDVSTIGDFPPIADSVPSSTMDAPSPVPDASGMGDNFSPETSSTEKPPYQDIIS